MVANSRMAVAAAATACCYLVSIGSIGIPHRTVSYRVVSADVDLVMNRSLDVTGGA